MRYQEPGRFGHVPVAPICDCPRCTIDSRNIVCRPVCMSVGGLWEVFYCETCGGTGAVNISCDQRVLEVYRHTSVSNVMRLWMNPIQEPNQN